MQKNFSLMGKKVSDSKCEKKSLLLDFFQDQPLKSRNLPANGLSPASLPSATEYHPKEYSNKEYLDKRYSDKEYSDKEYSDKGYSSKGYSSKEYSTKSQPTKGRLLNPPIEDVVFTTHTEEISFKDFLKFRTDRTT